MYYPPQHLPNTYPPFLCTLGPRFDFPVPGSDRPLLCTAVKWPLSEQKPGFQVETSTTQGKTKIAANHLEQSAQVRGHSALWLKVQQTITCSGPSLSSHLNPLSFQ